MTAPTALRQTEIRGRSSLLLRVWGSVCVCVWGGGGGVKGGEGGRGV